MGKQQKSSNKNLQPTKVEKAQTVEDLAINKKDLKKSSNKKPFPKKLIFSITTGILLLIITTSVVFLLLPKATNTPESDLKQLTEVEGTPTWFYDNLTGEAISHSGTQYDQSGTAILDETGKIKKLTIKQAEQIANDINSEPTFCIQMPNGADGARPQV